MKIMFVFTELNQKFGALRSQHGLFSLSAVLKQNGYPQVSMVYFSESLDLEIWQAEIQRQKPDLIGFYSTAEQFFFIKTLIEAFLLVFIVVYVFLQDFRRKLATPKEFWYRAVSSLLPP